jgi:hypothetical protein
LKTLDSDESKEDEAWICSPVETVHNAVDSLERLVRAAFPEARRVVGHHEPAGTMAACEVRCYATLRVETATRAVVRHSTERDSRRSSFNGAERMRLR